MELAQQNLRNDLAPFNRSPMDTEYRTHPPNQDTERICHSPLWHRYRSTRDFEGNKSRGGTVEEPVDIHPRRGRLKKVSDSKTCDADASTRIFVWMGVSVIKVRLGRVVYNPMVPMNGI